MAYYEINNRIGKLISMGYRIICTKKERDLSAYSVGLPNIGLQVGLEFNSFGMASMWFVGKDKGYDGIMLRACDIIMDTMDVELLSRAIYREDKESGKRLSFPIVETYSPHRFKFMDSMSLYNGEVTQPAYPKQIEAIHKSGLYTVTELKTTDKTKKYEIFVKSTGLCVTANVYNGKTVELSFVSGSIELDRAMTRVCDSIHDLTRDKYRLIVRYSRDNEYYSEIPLGETGDPERYSSIGKPFWKSCLDDEMHDLAELEIKPDIENLVDNPFYTVEFIEEKEGCKVYNVRRYGLDVDVGINFYNAGFTEMMYKKTDTFFGSIAVKFCDEVMDVMNVPDSIRSIIEVGESDTVADVSR